MNAAPGANRGFVPPDDFADYVVPRYSKRQVIEAGKLIAGKSPNATPELIGAFRLAHDWRGAHLRPMRRVRTELTRAARRHEYSSVVAARLKRMQSIRRKMQRRPMTLFQMQDIAGARAIMRDMKAVDSLVGYFRDGGSQFELQRQWDYIAAPKAGGYRSSHLRLVCPSETEDEAYARLQVEIQIRTRLQHSWATAVEAVGLVRSEHLKTGEGDSKWLRLFEVMASEFALEEDRPLVPGVSENKPERIAELRDLCGELDAIRRLESLNLAFRESEEIANRGSDFYYLIRYDQAQRQVTVKSYSRFSTVYEQFFAEERTNNNVVTVEVDRVSDLRRAYPNYFLDVKDFTDRLKDLVLPKTPPKSAKTKPRGASKWGDLSWLRNYQRA